MGFLTSPFYLFPKFFEGKAVEHLLGENIKVEYLNESRFGRVLDEIFHYGLTKLFVSIAMSAFKTFNVSLNSGHFDITSLSVEGEYIAKSESQQDTSKEQLDEEQRLKSLDITTTVSMTKMLDSQEGFVEEYLKACYSLEITPEVDQVMPFYQDWRVLRVDPFISL